MRKQDDTGFTLIELLIVVAIIGIIAAIAIPNLLNAVDRSKQKRTMFDMRSIATAVELYAIDHATYPTASTPAVLQSLIQPVYMARMPAVDAWNSPWVVDATAMQYTISSSGKDAVPGTCVNGALTTLFSQDICFSNGQFVQFPQGVQQ